MPDNLGTADAAAYAQGADPLIYSQGKVARIIALHLEQGLIRSLDNNPNGDLAKAAARILATLLDAGWTPPGSTP